jgi:hypothetical protein
VVVAVGKTAQSTATLLDGEGNILTDRQVVWETGAATIATVTDGLVAGVAVGSTQMAAVSEGQSGTATVTVVSVPVATVSVSPSSVSLNVGQAQQLTATVRDAAGNILTGRTVTWSTGSWSVAAVSVSGLVTAVGAGTATITATSEGQSGTATVTVTAATGCSTSLSNVSLPLCDGTYSQAITASTFPSNAVIQAQNPGKVRFTGSFSAGSNQTFRGIVVSNSGEKQLGSGNVYEDMSFVGGPSCGNTVNSLAGSNTTIRRSAFYGRGGRYLLLPWHVSGVVLEDVIFRTDGGWGDGGAGCTGYEPNAALNNYDSPDFTCIGCILFDGIVTAGSTSETLGGLGGGGHLTTSGALFENSLIVNSAGGFWQDGMGAWNNVTIRNSAALNATTWGLKRNLIGTTTVVNFTTNTNCGVWTGSIQLSNSRIGGTNDGCSGGATGAGASLQLNTTFLDSPRWRQEMCTDAGVTRGWCGTTKTLSEYLKSF